MSLMPLKATILSLLVILLFVASNATTGFMLEDHKTLIFQQCSTQKLDDTNGTYTNARKMLLQKLVSQSSQSKFSTTFVMVGDDFDASLSGLFQCRRDLDEHQCNQCIDAIQKTSNGFMCDDSMAARIQLSGCHVQYEADTYDNSTPEDHQKYIHKSCGEAFEGGNNFEQIRSQAFEELETGVIDEGNFGFYSIDYQGFHAVAQCEEGIGVCQCGECVADAVHVIEEECEVNSINAQVFMHSCFLSYEFNPHGGSGDSIPGKHIGGGKSGKLVAMAFGGIALLVMLFMLFRFCKKKNDDY